MTDAMPRLIRVSADLLDLFGTRTEDGRRMTAEWGDPDADGIYEPVFTATDDGMTLIPVAELTRLRTTFLDREFGR